MKRLLFIMMAIILVGGLMIVGCGEKETPTPTLTPTPSVTTTPTPSPTKTITPTPTPTKKPAAFLLSNLSIEPAECEKGETVTVSALVYNFGELTGSCEVNFDVNDETLEYKTVTLDGGAKETVTFTTTGTKSGTYTVKVNDLSGTFTVKAPPTPTPTGTAPPPAGPVVYVSVSVDSELLVAAQPIAYTDGMTLEDAIKAAHVAYYADGESGYDIGTNNAYGMYLVNKCWGVVQIPFIILNDHPNSETTFEAVNTIPVAANDNIILCTSNTQGAATPISLRATLSDDTATVTATAWTLNMATFQYTSAPLAEANVIDPVTGASLGTTDADGNITVTVPASGIVAIEGQAAIRVKAPSEGEEAEGEGEGEGGGEEVLSISWDEAGDHVGETVKMCGTVDSTMVAFAPEVTLFLGGPAGVGSNVQIKDPTQFEDTDAFIGKEICVTGEIYLNVYGTPTIDVTDPSQIEVVE
jgi:hypothetical protein